MSRALVLNASYEPLGTVAARRAVILVLGGKADSVHETDLVLHAERIAGVACRRWCAYGSSCTSRTGVGSRSAGGP